MYYKNGHVKCGGGEFLSYLVLSDHLENKQWVRLVFCLTVNKSISFRFSWQKEQGVYWILNSIIKSDCLFEIHPCDTVYPSCDITLIYMVDFRIVALDEVRLSMVPIVISGALTCWRLLTSMSQVLSCNPFQEILPVYLKWSLTSQWC